MTGQLPALNIQFGLPIPQLLSVQQTQRFAVKESAEKQILSILYSQWKAWTIAAKMDLQEFNDDLSSFQANKKRLRVKFRQELPKLQLGDHVKIKMKQRQIKQINNAGWNDLMEMDIGEIATVIGILVPSCAEAIISYPKSGLRWIINVHAVEVIHEKQQMALNCFTDLKIGDSVMIHANVQEYVITIMQSLVSLSPQDAIKNRDSLLKLLSFTGRDIAIVSIDQYKSIRLHVGLLSRNPATRETPTMSSNLFPACYSIGKQYLVKNKIEDLIKLPCWTYRHSKILGKIGTICYQERRDGVDVLGITVEGEGFLITTAYLRREWRTSTGRQRRRTGEREPYKLSQQYPYPVGAAVQYITSDDERCERMLTDLGIPRSFLKVVREECATFLGYDAPGRAQIEFQLAVNLRASHQRFTLGTPIRHLKSAPEAKETAHQEMLERLESLKVNDVVSLHGARYNQFIRQELDLVATTEEIKHAMTSNAKLMAFDDENDRAILQYDNGKMFSCSSGFVGVACADVLFAAPKETSSATTSQSRVISPDDDEFEPGTSHFGLSDKKDYTEAVNAVDKEDETVPKLLFTGIQGTHQNNGSAHAEDESEIYRSQALVIPPGTEFVGCGPPRVNPEPSNVSSELSDVSLASSDLLPVSSDLLPESSNALSESSDPLPESSNALPESSDPLPESSNALPELSDQLQESSDPLPESSDPLPESSDPLPESSDPLLESSDPLPESSDPLPESSEATFQHRPFFDGAIPVENHPTFFVDPTTRDFAVVGNLGRHVELCTGMESLHAGLRRRNSTRSAATENSNDTTIIGGIHYNYNMNNCTFDGTVNIGASPNMDSTN